MGQSKPSTDPAAPHLQTYGRSGLRTHGPHRIAACSVPASVQRQQLAEGVVAESRRPAVGDSLRRARLVRDHPHAVTSASHFTVEPLRMTLPVT